MTPVTEGFIQVEAIPDLLVSVRPGAAVVVRRPHPIQIGRRQSQNTSIAQGAAALLEKRQAIFPGQMLDEVLSENERHIAKWQTLRDIQHPVHAAQRLIGNLQREANGQPPITTNDGFTPELVVRGSTAPRHTVAPKR